MSKDERVFITRIKIFELYDEGTYTVVKLCRLFALSRTWFYKLKKRREAKGDEGLRSVSGKPVSFANQTPLEDELVVLDFLTEYPSYGPERVSSELGRRGLLRIGHTAVYGVMKRRDLNTKKKRRFRKIKEGREWLFASRPSFLGCLFSRSLHGNISHPLHDLLSIRR